MARVALDLLGGDGAPGVVADAVATLLAEDADIDLVLVGPPDVAAELLSARGVRLACVDVLPAFDVVPMDTNPLEVLRIDASSDVPRVSVMVAALAVGTGKADAWVSVGHTGAAVTAAVLACGKVPGMTRPALAVVLPAIQGPVVLVDAGAFLDASPETLTQVAMAGWTYARTFGVREPKVGLLNIGHEAGKGDELRSLAFEELASRLPPLGIEFIGNIEGSDVADGLRAQVVVTDGFTGNVLLKGIEGTVAWAAQRIGEAYGDAGLARAVVREVAGGDFAGGLLLGVNGVTVVGHGSGSANAIRACVRLAARAADLEITHRTRSLFASLAGKSLADVHANTNDEGGS